MGRTVKRPGAVEFGRRVRNRRQQFHLSQIALSEKMGWTMHFTYISQVERGERNISLENILRLAVGLRTDPSTLVKGLRPADSL